MYKTYLLGILLFLLLAYGCTENSLHTQLEDPLVEDYLDKTLTEAFPKSDFEQSLTEIFPESYFDETLAADFPEGYLDETAEQIYYERYSEDPLKEPTLEDIEKEQKNWGNLHEGYNSGHHNGFYWGVWKQGGAGAMELRQSWGNSASFKLSYWNNWGWNVRDIVGGVGWGNGNGRTIGYNFDAWGQWDFIGIYGWACSPRVEYYVVESQNGQGVNGQYKWSYWVEGVLYDFYIQYRSGPSACGGNSFVQFISKRRYHAAERKDGRVNMQQHINFWNYWSRSMYGRNMSYYQYQKFAIEGFNGRQGGMHATVW